MYSTTNTNEQKQIMEVMADFEKNP
jgi:hypothetical protein